MKKQLAIYIMANERNGTLHISLKSDLIKRVFPHKNVGTPGFSSRYDCKLLVYYELHRNILNAITKEMQIKIGSKKKKFALIEAVNPGWRNLCPDIL